MRSMADQVRAALAQRPEIAFAILFGSAASGNMGPSSDVDIAVRFRPGRAPAGWDFGGLVMHLESALSRRVDLIDLAATSSTLLHFEMAKGCLVKGDENEFVDFKCRAFRNWRDFRPRFERMAKAFAASVLGSAGNET